MVRYLYSAIPSGVAGLQISRSPRITTAGLLSQCFPIRGIDLRRGVGLCWPGPACFAVAFRVVNAVFCALRRGAPNFLSVIPRVDRGFPLGNLWGGLKACSRGRNLRREVNWFLAPSPGESAQNQIAR
jgi:hypothetical protein